MDEVKVTAVHKLIGGIIAAILIFSLTAFSEASKDQGDAIGTASQTEVTE